MEIIVINKTIDQLRAAFVECVVEYMTMFGYTGEDLAERVAWYVKSQWHYVEDTFDDEAIYHVDGGASDLTADFCCRLLAGRA